jgi:DNA-binding response OmpR family regulator
MVPQLLLYSHQTRVREILVAGLLQCDFHVIDTASPYMAVISAGKFPVDLLIVDITPTETRGMLAIRAFKKSIRLTDTPILILMPTEPEDLLESLCVEYLGKHADYIKPQASILNYPFHFAALVKRANALVKRA